MTYSQKYESSQTVQTVILGTIGFLLGGFLILCPAIFQEFDPATQTPEFLIWLFLVAVQSSIWAVAIIPICKTTWQLRIHLKKHFMQIVMTATPIIILTGIMFVWGSYTIDTLNIPLIGISQKTNFLSGIGFIVAMTSNICTWSIPFALKTVFDSKSDIQKINDYLYLHKAFFRCLTIAGTIVGMATLSSGLFWQFISILCSSIDQTCHLSDFQRSSIYSVEATVLYGLFFSGILLLSYASTYFALIAIARQLCDTLLPMPELHSLEWEDWHSKHQKLQETLKLNVRSIDCGAIATVLSPLLGSIVSLLLRGA